jgi:hypothetical protein
MSAFWSLSGVGFLSVVFVMLGGGCRPSADEPDAQDSGRGGAARNGSDGAGSGGHEGRNQDGATPDLTAGAGGHSAAEAGSGGSGMRNDASESDANATDASPTDTSATDASNSAEEGAADAAPSDGSGREAASAAGSLDAGRDARPTTFFRIMPVGDSITAGYTDNPNWNVPFDFGYRGALYDLLQANFPGRFTFVGASPEPWNNAAGKLLTPPTPPSPDLRLVDQDHHRGYGGWNATSISNYIGLWLASDDPDIVLLMAGINDIGPGSSAPPTAAENGLTAIVETIVAHKPDTEVLVAQITPYSGDTPALVHYNTWIRTVLVPGFQARGKHVSTVDQFAALLDGNGAIDSSLFANGINHPDQVGYDRMAKIWFDGLVPIFQR